MVRVLFFAVAREAAGCEEWQWARDEPATVEELWAALLGAFPNLAPLRPAVRLARNLEYFAGGDIRPGDEVALIPPVSGG